MKPTHIQELIKECMEQNLFKSRGSVLSFDIRLEIHTQNNKAL